MTPTLLTDRGIEERRSGQLSYLERRADSDTVTVFFHGLGLDATDYLGYLRQHDRHSVALNLRGYEPDGAGVPPVPLARHIQMAAAFVEQIGRQNAGKKLVLVGFSLGADLILQVAEHWAERGGDVPPLAAAVLLDPNVNQSTMTISRLFAVADPHDPVPAFKELINLAPDKDGFRSLCSYLAKVAPKDFSQVRQLSQDMITYWDQPGYDQFGTRLNNVAHIAERVRVVLSAAYQEHLSSMRAALGRRDGDAKISVRLTELDHFDLIGDEILSPELDALT
ncbi:alpha/beta fold hydrolase [Streptomyces sp.]|uniref:alpha/beta fold hydrolase n=1 Tax=Streptomyces sp. TaxID=1931 RepID=UPI002F3F8305